MQERIAEMQSLMLRGSAAGSTQVGQPKPARPALQPLPLVSGLSALTS
jgi:hypothetical protein